jgi:putative endonuclease
VVVQKGVNARAIKNFSIQNYEKTTTLYAYYTYYCYFCLYFYYSYTILFIMARHNQIGSWGENLACETLIADGCAIVDRNWRSGHYEVDIIAMKGNRIIFVEVKTRTNPLDDPVADVTRQKMRRIVCSANAYVQMYNIPHEIQYDIIAITGNPHDYKIEHIKDAYFPNLRTYR